MLKIESRSQWILIGDDKINQHSIVFRLKLINTPRLSIQQQQQRIRKNMGTQNVGRTWTGRVKVEMERIKTSSKSDSPTNSTRGKLKINDNYMSLRSFLL